MKYLACPNFGFDIVKIKKALEEDRRQQQIHEMLVELLRTECLDTLAEIMTCLDEEDFDEADAITPTFIHQYTAVYQTCAATATQVRITTICDIYNLMVENGEHLSRYANVLNPILGKFVTLLRTEKCIESAIHADVLSRVVLLVYDSGTTFQAHNVNGNSDN